MILLDCGFLFYFGHPTRIALAEIKADLPCIEEIFDDPHPFTREDFGFRRSENHAATFAALFSKTTVVFDSTVLDSFISIHCAYVSHFSLPD